jgi:hypothetical protein
MDALGISFDLWAEWRFVSGFAPLRRLGNRAATISTSQVVARERLLPEDQSGDG